MVARTFVMDSLFHNKNRNGRIIQITDFEFFTEWFKFLLCFNRVLFVEFELIEDAERVFSSDVDHEIVL